MRWPFRGLYPFGYSKYLIFSNLAGGGFVFNLRGFIFGLNVGESVGSTLVSHQKESHCEKFLALVALGCT